MKNLKSLFLILVVIFFSTGCVLKVGTSPIGRQGGVFVSEDNGANWANISRLLSLAANETFLGSDVINLSFDPQVSSTIYASTRGDGIFYTLDSGRSWQQTLSDVGAVYDIVVHPDNKCSIFAATGRKLYRSQDCARTWQTVLLETRSDEVLNRLAIDNSDTPILYVGSNMGSLYKSMDLGNSWQTLYFFETGLVDLVIAPNNYNIIYVGLQNKGISKSTDRGATWVDITSVLNKENTGFNNYHKLVISESDDSLVYANDYSIAISGNSGNSWRLVNLLTPPKSIYIYGLAVSSSDSNTIYYSSHDTFYKTVDGGDNWSTTRVPTSRVLSSLLISPNNESVIYAGASSKN